MQDWQGIKEKDVKEIKTAILQIGALKKTVLDFASKVNNKFVENKKALTEIEKKVDRMLFVAMQTAADLNLHKREHLKKEDNCHIAFRLQEHLEAHKKEAEKIEKEKKNRLETRLTKTQILGIIAGATGVPAIISALVAFLINKFF